MMNENNTKLRQFRLKRAWSIEDIADLTGLSVSMISRIERRQRDLRPEQKIWVARCLGCRVRDLFEVEGNELRG